MKYDASTVTIERSEYDALTVKIIKLEALVKHYEEQFRLAKHRQYGASTEKSEYDSAQLSLLPACRGLFNEAEAVSDANVPEPELTEIQRHFRKRKRLTSDRLPDDLPVEVIEHELPADDQICSECGGDLHVMGRDTRRELVIVPAQVKIREHRQAVYSCRRCENDSDHTPIVKASMPTPVIKGSFASPEAVAHVMAQKFVMSVPLYRQEQEWNRQGIMLSRQTMSNWLIRCTEDWLAPIYHRLKALLLEREVLHADETTVQVLHEPGKEAQSKSYMWMYRTGGDASRAIVLYEYKASRHARHPEVFLSDFKGYLHADGYDGYHDLPERIVVVGCWAHARRKFDEALKSAPEAVREGSNAMRGKRYCDGLFRIERECDAMPPKKRYRHRIRFAKPLMEEFFAWAEKLGALPELAIGKAIQYARSQRAYLERYLLDGRLEISNNRAERSIKPFVIGRKNWMFNQTPKGAAASAVIYSIIETAKENGVNPFDYLVHIFNNAPNLDVCNDSGAIDRLLPWAFKGNG